MAKTTVVYRIRGMEGATVRRAVPYSGALTLDLYYPPDRGSRLFPAVVIVLGYPDVGVEMPFGCQFREMGMTMSWARLFAASGMVGIVYETRDPANDAHAVLSYVRENGAALGIEGTRIGVWSSSGNVPAALSVLMDGKARCGVLCYGPMLDLDGATSVAQAAAQYHFANPCAGRGVEDIPPDTALFIARAGRDEYGNGSLDAFVAAALRANLSLTLVNHATGPHAFDLLDDSDASREVVAAILAFLRAKLSVD
ncbi:MAG TPA: alpha/beta hydrolase [Bryobacteraceae bacterium]|nr:alpha/beta hydrolase [Bryobacteraceae bacterium]